MLVPRRRLTLRTLVALVALPAAWTHDAASALAQSTTTGQGSFALNEYEPTPAGDRFLAVPSGAVDGDAAFRLGMTLDYAHNPLLMRDTCVDANKNGILTASECNQEGTEVGAVVAHQMALHVGVSYAVLDRLLLSLTIPMYLVNSGDSPANSRDATAIAVSPDGPAAGDLRLGLRLQLAGATDGPFELSLGSYVWFPTGVPNEYTGDAGVRAAPHAAFNGKIGGFVYGGQIGAMLRDGTNIVNVGVGSELTYGLAAGLLLSDEKLQIGPEFYGSTTFGNGVDAFKGRTSNAEILGAIRYRTDNFSAGVAFGPGVTHGIGTPDVRGLVSVAFAPAEADGDGDGIADSADACPKVKGVESRDASKNGCPPDRDGDGVLDENDACPDEAGIAHQDPAMNGCPSDRDGDAVPDVVDACPDAKGVADADPQRNGCPPDRDLDGILDEADACPDVKGVASEDAKKNGCPADKDYDTVFDAQDACPDVPGKPDADPAQNGCPGDTDGDGVRDDKDACPQEKGVQDPDPEKNGCPTKVRVTKGAIKILQQVQFATGSAKILPESDDLLGQVAATLKEHPEIKKVRVDGHTDDRGNLKANRTLSADRAKSVVKWLADHGVDAGRLESAGFGQEKPIADNKTDAGRQQNRRVELNIIDPPPPDGIVPPPAAPPPVGAGQAPKSVPPKPKDGSASGGAGPKAPPKDAAKPKQ